METDRTTPPSEGIARRGSAVALVATAITYGVNPLIIPPLLLWLVLDGVEAPAAETAVMVVAALLLLSVVPALFLVWMVHSGRSVSLNLEDRRHRTRALAIGLAGAAALMILAWLTLSRGRDLVMAVLIVYVVGTCILILINRQWKISLHAASAAGFFAVIAFVRGTGSVTAPAFAVEPLVFGVVTVVIVCAVAWARLKLRAHTPGQVLAGAAVGFLVPYFLLSLINTIRPLADTG
ncbi:MAG: hypothetical protein HKN13_04335 [Rhodothermales bacterium]|nr:hypothetical protein [Rhodothermales bacterium]